MKRKPYSYRCAVKISCATHGNDAALTRVLRKLVRESLLCTVRPKADGKHYEVYEAWANRIARRMVP